MMYTAPTPGWASLPGGLLWPPCSSGEWRLLQLQCTGADSFKEVRTAKSLGETPLGIAGAASWTSYCLRGLQPFMSVCITLGRGSDLLAFNNFLSKKSSSFYSHSNCGWLTPGRDLTLYLQRVWHRKNYSSESCYPTLPPYQEEH